MKTILNQNNQVSEIPVGFTEELYWMINRNDRSVEDQQLINQYLFDEIQKKMNLIYRENKKRSYLINELSHYIKNSK